MCCVGAVIVLYGHGNCGCNWGCMRSVLMFDLLGHSNLLTLTITQMEPSRRLCSGSSKEELGYITFITSAVV